MPELFLVVVINEVILVQASSRTLSVATLDCAVQTHETHFTTSLLVQGLAFTPALSGEVLLSVRRQ